MSFSRLGFVLLCFTLVLAGFGCKKPEARKDLRTALTQTPSLNIPKIAAPTPAAYKSKGDTEGAPEVMIVRQAIKNLAQADSFRATLIIPAPDGKARGEMEFVRGKGMHAGLSFPGAPGAEFYLKTNQLVFRSGTSSWQDIGSSEQGVQIRQLFQQAFPTVESTSTTFISKSARFLNIKEDKDRNCKMYEFSQYTLAGDKQRVKVCIQNSLPVYVSTPVADGDLEATYRDFNQTIPLDFPL